MNESQVYTQLFKGSVLNDEKTKWLVREGYLGEYDPTYVTNKAELFIEGFEKPRIEKVMGYLKLNGSITQEKLRELAAVDAEAFDIFVSRLVKQHRLLRKKPGSTYVPGKNLR